MESHLFQIPTVVVAVAAGLRWNDYSTSTACWLSSSHEINWSFYAPALIILLVDAYVLLQLFISFRIESENLSKAQKHEQHRHRLLRNSFRYSLIVTLLVCATWILGAMALKSLIFEYIFAVLNVTLSAFLIVG